MAVQPGLGAKTGISELHILGGNCDDEPTPPARDHVVDLVHDELETLQEYCAVSKLWLSRTRKHLFARVNFSSPKDVESRKKAFPDTSNSPAYHTHTLLVTCPETITAESRWAQTLSRLCNRTWSARRSRSSGMASNLIFCKDNRPPCVQHSTTRRKLFCIFTPSNPQAICTLFPTRFPPLLVILVTFHFYQAGGDKIFTESVSDVEKFHLATSPRPGSSRCGRTGKVIEWLC